MNNSAVCLVDVLMCKAETWQNFFFLVAHNLEITVIWESESLKQEKVACLPAMMPEFSLYLEEFDAFFLANL